MFALLVLVFAIVLIVAVALAVIGALALRRRSKEQWRARVRTASQLMLDGKGLDADKDQIRAQHVSFDELWKTESVEGNAYWDLPPYLTQLEEQARHLTDKVRESKDTPAVDQPAAESAASGEEAVLVTDDKEGGQKDNEQPTGASLVRFSPTRKVSGWVARRTDSRDEHPVG